MPTYWVTAPDEKRDLQGKLLPSSYWDYPGVDVFNAPDDAAAIAEFDRRHQAGQYRSWRCYPARSGDYRNLKKEDQ